MRARYRNLPIRDKLRLIIMTTVSISLLLVCAAVLAYDDSANRQSMRNDLAVLAEMTGANSTAALSFGDARAAEELLSGLKAKRGVILAFLYSADGRPFAAYHRKASV